MKINVRKSICFLLSPDSIAGLVITAAYASKSAWHFASGNPYWAIDCLVLAFIVFMHVDCDCEEERQ